MNQNELLLTAESREDGALLEYRTVRTQARGGASGIWSLAVIRQGADGEVESRFLYDIARDCRAATKLAELFCRNRVTPCCADELVDDLLGND